MQKSKPLPHFFSITELADLISQPPELIARLVRCGIHPPWTWRERWHEPRFAIETLPEWLQILDTVNLDTLPENPPPLERPAEAFRNARRKRDSENAELELILKHFPARVAERLRAEA